MSLGTKINLVLAAVTITVLTVAFWVMVSIESADIKQQVINQSGTIADMLKDDIERMLRQVRDQQEYLQAVVDKLGRTEGVKYIKVTDTNGYIIAATNRGLVGKRVSDDDVAIITQMIKEGKVADVRNDAGTFVEFERHIPVHLRNDDESSSIIGVVEVGVSTRSKSVVDSNEAQKLLQAVSVSLEQSARSIIVTRNDDLAVMQKITDEVKRFDFYHDFIVFDNQLNIIVNTDKQKGELANDSQEYKQYREDVLSGKIRDAAYQRVHDGHEVLVRVSPIQITQNSKAVTVGLLEVHVFVSSYQDKIDALKFRMLGIGIIVTAALVLVLMIVLRMEVVGPITRYSRIAKKVADGDLTQRIKYISHDEIGRFGEVFNSMVANLHEIDRLKTDFITVAAHQLRTPLSSVKWALKLLLDNDIGNITEEQGSMVRRAYDTNDKMIQLVNDLLNVSRIENGKYGFKFEENDLNKLLATLLDNVEPASRERNVQVIIEKHEEIPLFVFDFDKLLIAFQNIVDNAIKYTLPGGKVTIVIEREGDYLHVKISDTGVGIPSAELPKLFSKFFRASNVVHLQTEGSGLGLVISKSVVVRHGGQIWVDSIEGKGTTFTIVIPLLAELLPKEELAPVEKGVDITEYNIHGTHSEEKDGY